MIFRNGPSLYAVRIQYFYALRFSLAAVFTAITVSKVGKSLEMLHSNDGSQRARAPVLATVA